jgi:hypothetical protein
MMKMMKTMMMMLLHWLKARSSAGEMRNRV